MNHIGAYAINKTERRRNSLINIQRLQGEVTLWRGYSQVTGDSPIFRWNQQHFNYILVSVARFLPYFI